jgi:hypothetical protein
MWSLVSVAEIKSWYGLCLTMDEPIIHKVIKAGEDSFGLGVLLVNLTNHCCLLRPSGVYMCKPLHQLIIVDVLLLSHSLREMHSCFRFVISSMANGLLVFCY